MRSFRTILLLAGVISASTLIAHADTVTISISEEASGTLGNQSFTNQLVTFTGSFTSEQFAACQFTTCDQGSGFYFMSTLDGLLTTFTVGGLDTFAGTSNDFVGFYYDTGSLANIGVQEAGDSDWRLYFPTAPIDVEDCQVDFPAQYCPLSASTSGGFLIPTAVSDISTTSVELSTGNPAVPEPSTFVLFVTGILGGSEFFRRRLRSA